VAFFLTFKNFSIIHGGFMIQNTDNTQSKTASDDITKFKDDQLAPKGHTKHIVETDWPTQEASPLRPNKKKTGKRTIKKTQNARLP
jgi:hypothetical protein